MPAQDKTYNKTCMTSKDSDQPVHPPSMAKVLIYLSLASLEAVEGRCDQQRLSSACAYAGSFFFFFFHFSMKICCENTLEARFRGHIRKTFFLYTPLIYS